MYLIMETKETAGARPSAHDDLSTTLLIDSISATPSCHAQVPPNHRKDQLESSKGPARIIDRAS